MLRGFDNFLEKRKFLESLNDLDNITFVVSDWKSKKELENFFLEKKGYLESNSVLRVSEFWKALFLQKFFNKQVINESMCKTISEYHTGSAQSFYSLRQFLSVFIHPQGEEVFQDWLENNHKENVNLNQSFQKSQKLWQFLKDKGLVADSFIPALLVNEDDVKWDKKVYFDLGASLTVVEAELLRLLKTRIDLEVLEPTPSWKSQYHESIFSYEILKTSRSTPMFDPVSSERFSLKENVRLEKHPSCLEEIKSALTGIKKWHNEGVNFSQIALVSPQIEEYMPVLEPFLKQEGIPFQRKSSQKLTSLPSVHKWLCRLRVSLDLSFSKFDLEGALFSDQESPVSYSQFKREFTDLYSKEQLENKKELASLLSSPPQKDKLVSFEDFINWSFEKCESSQPQIEKPILNKILSEVYDNLYENLLLSFSQWFFHLEKICSELEVSVEESSGQGIFCESIYSSENLRVSHIFILGVTETFLSSRKDNFEMSLGDLKSFYDQTGFALEALSHHKKEFELAWLLEGADSFEDVVLSYPMSHFSGMVLEPSWIWLSAATKRDQNKLTSFQDESFFSQFKNAEESQIVKERELPAGESLLQVLSWDQGEGDFIPVEEGEKLNHMSASQTKTFKECPFRWASRYLFQLSDQPEEGIELSPIKKGSLTHEILENLSKEKSFPFKISDKRKNEILDKVLEDVKDEFRESKYLFFLSLADKFLKFEQERSRKDPTRKFLASEAKIEGFWDQENKVFTLTQTPQSVKVTGSVDRIDELEGGEIEIFDYKSGSSESARHANFKAEKNSQIGDFQLWIYLQAARKGLLEFGPKEVLGSYYYCLKDFKIHKGINKKCIDEELDESYGLISESLNSCLKGMQMREIEPQPLKKEVCDKCKWREVCRARHLKF